MRRRRRGHEEIQTNRSGGSTAAHRTCGIVPSSEIVPGDVPAGCLEYLVPAPTRR